jgi:hypothetical protein
MLTKIKEDASQDTKDSTIEKDEDKSTKTDEQTVNTDSKDKTEGMNIMFSTV